jgi:hypothetical protein
VKRQISYLILLAALGLSLLIIACNPLGLLEPTPAPTATPLARQDTPTPTDTPTLVPSPTPTATVLPPTDTATPTFTALPPTQTPTLPPTATPVPPTATPLPPTATPVPPTATPTPVVITDWRGEYYPNPSLQPPPQVVRNDRVVDFTFASGTSPVPGLPAENWSARWSRTWNFDEGTYRFHLLVDDGARLWINGQLLIDAWADGPARKFTGDLYLKGQTSIQLDYYNHLGEGRVRLNWEQITQFEGWLGTYYATRDLSGLPVFQRGDPNINFDWGSGSPRSDIPADNFSVRWTRRLSFDQTGNYQFVAESDDGVRLWVDGTLVIDAWQDGRSTHQGTIRLSAGQHDLRVDYYEHLGNAYIQVGWSYLAAPTPAPTPTFTPLPPTATPAPGRPTLALQPEAGPLGQPFTASGSGWPANTVVNLSLVQPLPKPGKGLPLAQVSTNGAGTFRSQVVVPKGQGWEGLPSAILVAQTADQSIDLQAAYLLQPALEQIQFTPFPATEPRAAEPEPLYLVLDSQAAWSQWFGPEPPQANPPIDWQQEIVLAAFLGLQPADVQPQITSLVKREDTVSAWLSVILNERTIPEQGQPAQVMVRVPRSELPLTGKKQYGELTFVFLDASGNVLAQGPMGQLESPLVASIMEEPSLAAPTAEGTALSDSAGPLAAEATAPVAEATAEATAPALAAPREAPTEGPTEVATQVEAPPPAAAATGVPGAQPVRSLANWAITLLGIALLVVVLLAAGGLGLYLWSRRR